MRRTIGAGILGALLLVGSAGCQATATETVREMRSQACAGNAAGFFAHVDRKEFADTMVREAQAAIDAKAATLSPLLQAGFRRGARESIGDLPKIADEGFVDWEQDMRRGEAGDLCRTSIIGGTEAEYSADVQVRTPTGHDKTWRLSRTGKRWFLIGMTDSPVAPSLTAEKETTP